MVSWKRLDISGHDFMKELPWFCSKLRVVRGGDELTQLCRDLAESRQSSQPAAIFSNLGPLCKALIPRR